MQRVLLLISIIFITQSCIPLRIAPKIEDHKVVRGKKFKRSLSKRQMFIFENHKEDGHFYNYINTKFNLNDENVYDDVPFMSNGEQYFLAWYEVEIPDKAINLFPLLFSAGLNAALGNDDDDLDEPEEIRSENYYIAIEVYNDIEPDCLKQEALSREVVLKYLRSLKKEYLSTHNYNEVVFKN